MNTFLPAHVDEDAFFSITSTICCNEICVEGQNERKKHTNECPISNYFTFPSTGHAVGLRPGDILMFNPLYTHCMSSKTDEYNGIDVANISLYTKMQNIYKHGNDIELTDKEERIYEKMNKGKQKIEKKTVDLTVEKVGKEKKKTKIEEMRNVVQNEMGKDYAYVYM